jgi:hypothetical protein
LSASTGARDQASYATGLDRGSEVSFFSFKLGKQERTTQRPEEYTSTTSSVNRQLGSGSCLLYPPKRPSGIPTCATLTRASSLRDAQSCETRLSWVAGILNGGFGKALSYNFYLTFKRAALFPLTGVELVESLASAHACLWPVPDLGVQDCKHRASSSSPLGLFLSTKTADL